MKPSLRRLAGSDAAAEIHTLATPLADSDDVQQLVDHVGANRLVCIGEASHGTLEFYRWRAEVSRRLFINHGFGWIGVQGDWPDCWRINRWVRGPDQQDRDVYGVLAHFDRWPTWMWAYQDVAVFLDWLHEWNLSRPVQQRVGFYGGWMSTRCETRCARSSLGSRPTPWRQFPPRCALGCVLCPTGRIRGDHRVALNAS